MLWKPSTDFGHLLKTQEVFENQNSEVQILISALAPTLVLDTSPLPPTPLHYTSPKGLPNLINLFIVPPRGIKVSTLFIRSAI